MAMNIIIVHKLVFFNVGPRIIGGLGIIADSVILVWIIVVVSPDIACSITE